MKRTILAVSFIAGFATAACAQTGGPPPPPPSHGRHFNGEMRGFAREMGVHPWKVVTGAPYSATVTQQFTRTLANGTTISRTTTGQIARDSSGRTYQQQTISGGPFGSQNGPRTVVFITDPVAGYSYMLDSSKKIAIRRLFHARASNGPPPRRMHPRRENNTNRAVTDLGTQTDASGLEIQGKEITRIIPAGAIGNSQAISSVTQTWYSPALQIVVRSARNDPRFGHSTYALSNISQAEPNPALFTVPADYTIKDAKRGPGGSGFRGSGPPPQPQN